VWVDLRVLRDREREGVNGSKQLINQEPASYKDYKLRTGRKKKRRQKTKPQKTQMSISVLLLRFNSFLSWSFAIDKRATNII
jgi:hypothetical protein